MAETPVPITYGSGQASIAGDIASGALYQQIKLVDGTIGSNTALIVNADGTLNARISGSVLSAGSTFNGSVSGTVGASIIGLVPVNIVSGGTTGSVSGTVGASIIGQLPAGTAPLGSVATLQGTNPWVIVGSVYGSGSVVAFQGGAQTTSIVGGASVFQTGTWSTSVMTNVITSIATAGQVMGSVAALQATNPWNVAGSVAAFVVGNSSVITVVQSSVAVTIVSGSIAATFTPPANQSVSGTVQTDVRASVAVVIIGGSIAASFTPPANQSVSGTVNIGTGGPVSVVGTMSVLGTVPVTQVTSPWIVTGSVQGSFSPSGNQSVSGTVNIGSVLIGNPATVSAANSTSTPVTSTLSFTGTGEEWKDYGTITVNVFTDATSATDGLSIQQSSDNANWDIRDTYTIPSMAAGQGKTFGLQPAARFGRVVYTQGAQNSGAFRLQTVYHPQYTKPSSQRPSDGYTNETDLEQQQSFNMVYDQSSNSWYRQRGTSSLGSLVYTTSSIVALVTGNPSVSGTVGASIVGQLPGGTAVLGSVAALQGTNPWIITSSIAGGLFPISGSVAATITNTNVNVGGSVVAFQGTSPFVVNFQNSSILAVPVGSTIALLQSSSILSVPVGSTITVFQAPSIVGTYAEDAASASGDKGFLVMGARNDTLASVTSADGDYSSHVVGPAGELIAENAPLTKWIQGTADFRNGNAGASIVLMSTGGTSVFSYITGLQVANMGSASVLVTLVSSGSILGYTIAPAGGGSNIYYQNALKTPSNGNFAASISGIASVLVSAQGFVSKT